jgi:hypothetical protein
MEEYQDLMRSSSTTSEAIQLSTPSPEVPGHSFQKLLGRSNTLHDLLMSMKPS